MIMAPADLLDFHPTLRLIRQNGACRNLKDPDRPDDFFPSAHGNSQYIVRAYCNHCPVIAECLEWALAEKETGVWGATTDRQRVGIRRQRGMA